ncbi:MAG: XdhC family protein [Elusimicrobia bacterium]|nr:XdhC family protein [Elusimicrobiota bacterium]
MLVLEDGTFSGSICSGCIEAEVYMEAMRVMRDWGHKIMEFK